MITITSDAEKATPQSLYNALREHPADAQFSIEENDWRTLAVLYHAASVVGNAIQVEVQSLWFSKDWDAGLYMSGLQVCSHIGFYAPDSLVKISAPRLRLHHEYDGDKVAKIECSMLRPDGHVYWVNPNPNLLNELVLRSVGVGDLPQPAEYILDLAEQLREVTEHECIVEASDERVVYQTESSFRYIIIMHDYSDVERDRCRNDVVFDFSENPSSVFAEQIMMVALKLQFRGLIHGVV